METIKDLKNALNEELVFNSDIDRMLDKYDRKAKAFDTLCKLFVSPTSEDSLQLCFERNLQKDDIVLLDNDSYKLYLKREDINNVKQLIKEYKEELKEKER